MGGSRRQGTIGEQNNFEGREYVDLIVADEASVSRPIPELNRNIPNYTFNIYLDSQWIIEPGKRILMNNYPPAFRYLVRLLLAFAIVVALVTARTLLAPLFFAVLFAYLLYPSAKWMEDRGISRVAANFILIIGSIAFLFGFIFLIASLVTSFTENIPEIRAQFKENINSFRQTLKDTAGITIYQQNNLLEGLGSAGNYLNRLFSATTNTILAIGLIPVYTFLLLFYRNKFRTFISMLVNQEQEQIVENIADQVAEVMPRYLKGLFVVCFILIWLNSLGFYLIGLRYALLLGTVAAILNLIPYIGTVIGYGVVCIFVLTTQSPSLALLVVVQFFVVQFLENNILTPNITGSYVRINPLFTILSLIAGGMIWGLPGMFMVIPYLAMFKIGCENTPSLKPVGYLLSTRGTEQHSVSFQSLKETFGWTKK